MINKTLKALLKATGIYHPLQSLFRQQVQKLRLRKLRAAYAPYEGSGYTCNFCGHSYSRFVPWYPPKQDAGALSNYKVVSGYGENILCPNCLSTARERLVREMLERSALQPTHQVLLLAPEKKIFDFLSDHAVVTTADLHPGFYRRIDPRISYADATRLPFNDQSFDLVIANHILEHIPDDLTAMRELHRVLKVNGKAILQVPFSTSIPHTLEHKSINDPAEQSRRFGQHDHVRIYALNDYIQLLQQAGFQVSYVSPGQLSDLNHLAIQPGEGWFSVDKLPRN